MKHNITIGVNGSTDIEFGRKTIEFGFFSKKTKTFTVTQETFDAIKDAYNGKIDSSEAFNIASKEIDEFYLDGIIILSPDQIKSTDTQIKKEPKVTTKKETKKESKIPPKKKSIRKLPLKRAVPIKVPFNVNDNEGIEGECVKRIIKPKKNSIYPGSKKEYTGETVDDLIKYCEQTERSLKLYDITGKVFHKSEHPAKKDYPGITALIHDQHIYDCPTKTIKLNNEVSYNKPEDNYVYYKKGEYIITSGVHKEKKSEVYVETNLPVSSFDPCIAEILKESVIALAYYNKDEAATGDNYTIDCNKCYYTTATESNYIERYGIFSIFDKFEPFSKQDINEYSFYQIHAPESYKFGVTTNFVGGRTLKALRNLNIQIRILKVLNPYKVVSWEHNKIKELFDDHKKFNIYNGMCGKVDVFFSTEIEINDPLEREYLLNDHPEFWNNPFKQNVITTVDRFNVVNGYLHRYLTVVDAANARVLRTLRNINLPCIKIKTDSLTFKSNVAPPEGWKCEEYRPSLSNTSYVNKLKIHNTNYERNVCILGPPGTGKSHLVKNEYRYDYAAAYTNKSALNCSTQEIQGQTLHVLFNLMSTKSLFHLKDKTVWIDEISMIPRWIWGYIIEAYINFNTSFIFSGDFNQTTPVGENTLCVINFLGKIKKLTKDYRNDNQVIDMRESILKGDLDHNTIIYSNKDELPLCNIAYTNEKVTEVNNMIVEKYNLIWGAKGTKVIANETVKKLGIAKNQSYILTDTFEVKNGVKLPEELFTKLFKWGYCYTVHKSQGDTIKEDLGIHEFKKYNKSIQYTAITRVCNYKQLKFFE